MPIEIDRLETGNPTAGTGDGLPFFIGACSGGTVNEVTFHGSPGSIQDTLQDGPLVQQSATALVGTGVVGCVKVTGSVAGAFGSVTVTRKTSSTGTITLAGEPTDDYQTRVVCTLTGTLDAGEFKFSLDGGKTYSPSMLIPAGGTYLVPRSGVTLTFVPGAGSPFFEKDDLFSFDTTGPFFGITEIAAAFDAIRALSLNPTSGVNLCGRPADAATAMTLAAALNAQLVTGHQTGVFSIGIMDAGRDTPAAIRTAVLGTAAPNVAPAVQRIRLAAGIAFMGYGLPFVPLAYAATARNAQTSASESITRVASGAIDGAGKELEYNEEASGLFKNAGAISARIRTGQGGIYFSTDNMLAPVGSSLNKLRYINVMNLICRVTYQASQVFEADSFRVVPDGTGYIDERDAVRVEKYIQAVVDVAVTDPTNASGFKGHVSAVKVQVDRAFNILAAERIEFNVVAVKLAYGDDVKATVGFAASVGGQ